jgi:hypothetical protein
LHFPARTRSKANSALPHKAGIPDEITEVNYMFTRPGSDILVQKVSFVTRVGDLGCGVGYEIDRWKGDELAEH